MARWSRTLVRDPQNLFFTVGLPLLYLFIFATIFGTEEGSVPGQPGLMNVAMLGLWTIGETLMGLRTFRWTPTSDG